MNRVIQSILDALLGTCNYQAPSSSSRTPASMVSPELKEQLDGWRANRVREALSRPIITG